MSSALLVLYSKTPGRLAYSSVPANGGSKCTKCDQYGLSSTVLITQHIWLMLPKFCSFAFIKLKWISGLCDYVKKVCINKDSKNYTILDVSGPISISVNMMICVRVCVCVCPCGILTIMRFVLLSQWLKQKTVLFPHKYEWSHYMLYCLHYHVIRQLRE